MDLAFDLENAAAGRMDGRFFPVPSHPSWPELRARLFATLDASDSLTRENRSAYAFYLGSFSDAAAACVAAHGKTHHSVNPKDLGNLKSGGATIPTVAGVTRTGGRG